MAEPASRFQFTADRPPSGSVPLSDSQQELFVRLLSASHSSIYGFVVSLVGDSSVADDLTQELCLLLWRKFDTFNTDVEGQEAGFLRWALVSARNLARNYHRLQKSHALLLDDELLSKISATRCAAEELLEIRRDALRLCLRKLSASDRKLVTMCYGGGARFKSVAAEFGKSTQTLYVALSRVRRRLFHCINKTLGLIG